MTLGHTGKGCDALYGDINARALGNGSPIFVVCPAWALTRW